MKQKISKIAIVALFAIGMSYNAYSHRDKALLSEVALDNIEALAAPETTGKVCYKTVTFKESCYVWYCGNCKELTPGTYSWNSGTGTC